MNVNILSQSEPRSIYKVERMNVNARMRTEIDLNESEIDLNECEYTFSKRTSIDL